MPPAGESLGVRRRIGLEAGGGAVARWRGRGQLPEKLSQLTAGTIFAILLFDELPESEAQDGDIVRRQGQ